jgi:thiol-disulfide isomerase/thioredoxin
MSKSRPAPSHLSLYIIAEQISFRRAALKEITVLPATIRTPARWLLAAIVFTALSACLPVLLPTEPTAVPEPAHSFTLSTLDGNSLALSDYQGHWVLVNFWATWCGPCVDEMPYLQELATTHEDLTVLGVNMREQPSDIEPFVNDLGITFPILLNPDDAMLLAYSPQGLPLTYVIAPKGTVVYRQYGPLEPEHFDAWLDMQKR